MPYLVNIDIFKTIFTWRRKWQPTPVFLPGISHGQSSLGGLQSRALQRTGHNLATEQQHTIRQIVIFLLYNIVLVLTYIDMNPPQYICVPHPEPTFHLLPHPIPLGHPSAPVPSILYHASNLDWQFVSHVILYMFQCHSPKSSHPHPLPQSPKDCSIHLCLFCCLAYRVIITIFLNSIYMH